MKNKNAIKKRISAKTITALAMFAAFAYVVHFIHIPVMFLNLDFKDVIITISGMFFGPIAGVVIAVIVPLLEFLTSSQTGPYGLIMNILSSGTFVGVASLIYRYKRSLLGAIIGLCSAVLAMVSVMLVANLLITPYYMGVSADDVVALIPTLLLPFNAVKGILNASLTLCLYKPVSIVLKKAGLSRRYDENATNNGREISKNNTVNFLHTVLVWVIGVVIATVSLLIIFFVLGGTIAFN